ncbi:CheR family methyltransferase [Acetobacterium woodii]|uniref:protein-glutamate O-methyltransferase n=1 Tax=Acetobacterium woodii (strain ATCC 29683 / DSM 1030 / JCM 2381 / KCTC 1655 / WB1) TaxID=931626 RepID=H6LJ84_ACEWD|nr:protein-glutamate O-methyltransferase CheR [Acetobacterium woodii]AFA48647.1 chemotaxis protein methyltransferase CheR1 [Acetobacterium woodii DSM 1030]
MVALSEQEYQLFQRYIAEKCGIALDDSKAYLVESRLAKLLIDSQCDTFSELFWLLQNHSDANIETRVIDAITTNETYWFRDSGSWQMITQIWLPQKIAEIKAGRHDKIRIWSAAASTGQEIYSLIIIISEYLKNNQITTVSIDDFEFLATDISTNVLTIARRGYYDPITIMRGLKPELREAYFNREGTLWVLKEDYRKRVRFEQFNLQNSFLLLGKFDLVFCRNVLIYFTEALRNDVFKKTAQVLKPKGLLLIGAAEIYYSMDNYFQKNITGDGTYFTVKEAAK